MTSILRPQDAGQVADAIAWAVSAEAPLEIVGGGSLRGIGRPLQVDTTLDLSALDGITLYEPQELVLSARAATPLARVKDALAAANQELAFEPPDLGPLFGQKEGAGTLGGVLAGNLSGPRRLKAGAARDHFLGFAGVSGRGEAFKSGGRVVKNVTGYDLCKAMAGSWGTLAVMTDVTVKVLPAAETQATLLITGLADEAAMAAMSAALVTPYDVSAAAHLPAGIAAGSSVATVTAAGGAVTALRLEGIAASVAYRVDRLRSHLEDRGAMAVLDAEASAALWREIRDVRYLAGDVSRPVWRVSVPPMSGAALVASVGAAGGARAFYDWGGGLVWIDFDAADDAHGVRLRTAVAATGGHATLIRAAHDIRTRVEVFQPQSPHLAALARRLKEGFDPRGILNPGRMYAGV
jgi:glycolate oxidase FAD binding subunit